MVVVTEGVEEGKREEEAYPMLLAEIIPLNATPTSIPIASKTGPPELPGLMAASICTGTRGRCRKGKGAGGEGVALWWRVASAAAR